MDGLCMWEPCRGVTDGDRHTRVRRGSAALGAVCVDVGKAGRSLRAPCVPLEGKKRAAGAARPRRRGARAPSAPAAGM